MSDMRERGPVTCVPSAGGYGRSHVQLAALPHVPVWPMTQGRGPFAQDDDVAAERDARMFGKDPERGLDMHSIVGRLLAEGDDIEDTLTRICAVLRDAMGWDEVAFRPATGEARAVPAVNALMSTGDSGTVFSPDHSASPANDAWPLDYMTDAGTPTHMPDANDGDGGSTFRYTCIIQDGGRRNAFAFPVRGAHAPLGILECWGEQAHAPDAALLSAAAALGPAIGRFIERRLAAAARRALSETERQSPAPQGGWASQLEGVFEALPDSVVIFDRDGRIVHVNAADREVFGYEPHASSDFTSTLRERGQRLALRDDSGRPITDTHLPATRILQGETLRGRTAVQALVHTPDGREICVRVSGAPTYDADGAVVGGVAIAQDITECWQQERALRETNRRMEEFLAIAAHELRTPITSSRGYVQLAAKRLSNLTTAVAPENSMLVGKIENARRNLKDAEHSTQHLAVLVDRLLDAARIQTGKLEVRPEAANLVAIVRTTVQAQRLAAPHRVIRCKLPSTLAVPTFADSTRVGQVLMNYLSNALKYSPEDSSVEVVLEAGRKQARVSVRDEGAGIARAKQKRIWSRFEQIDGAPQGGRTDPGLGLGLYISRAIVEAHGGRVGIKSTVGQGSTFWFSLPLMPTEV